MRLLLIVLMLIPMSCLSATWYVDVDNVSGTTNGTSWATAWRHPGDVVWGGAGVAAGDTVEISDGVYTNGFVPSINGTTSSRITIKKSREVGHTGIALINGELIAGLSGRSFITIDGGLSDAFTAPTNYQQVITGATAITNNVGLISSNAQVGFYANSPIKGITIRWVSILSATNHADLNQSAAFSFPIGSGGVQTNNVIEYCYVSVTGGDAVQWTGGDLAAGYNEKIIRYCWFRDFGDDGVQANHGFTIDGCVIGPAAQLTGHADFIQSAGEYITLKNTWWRDGGLNSVWRIQAGYGDGQFEEDFGHYRFFNNLMTFEEFTRGTSPNGGTYVSPASPIEFVSYNPQNGNTNTYWTDLVLANNTAFGYTNISNPFLSWSMSFGSGGGNSTNMWISNSIVANNVIVDMNKGFGGANWESDVSFPPYGEHYRATELVLDYNISTGTNSFLTDAKAIAFRGTAYADGTAMASGEIWDHNTTNYPVFVNLAARNFELSGADTAALNTGTNLNVFFTTDILGRTRGNLWSRGAFESDAGLVLFLSFDNDTAGGNATDDTGNGYTGVRFALSEYSYPSNRNVGDLGNTQFRPNASGKGMDFLWRTNNGTYNPTYLDDGAFFGITNAFNALSNLSQMTVMCWARYQNNNRTDYHSPGYEQEANAVLVSGGGTAHGTKGSWFLGRYNNAININETRFVIHTNNGAFTGSWGSAGDAFFGRSGQVIGNYLDRGYELNGNTTNWYHYAATFSNGIVKTFFNGVPIGTNDISANVSVLRLGGSGQRSYDWVGIGVNTHVGTPEFDNESGTDYPNNGWLNGAMDQVRIYNRALSHQEIVDVANSEGAEFADAPAGGDPGGVSGTVGPRLNLRLSP